MFLRSARDLVLSSIAIARTPNHLLPQKHVITYTYRSHGYNSLEYILHLNQVRAERELPWQRYF